MRYVISFNNFDIFLIFLHHSAVENLTLHPFMSYLQRNVVWISCYGENPHDKESLGEVNYYPYRGFPGYYHPFRNTPGYLSPLVAVQFVRPKRMYQSNQKHTKSSYKLINGFAFPAHVLINIECRAWAKNIEYKRTLQNREGSVHFELQID